MDTTNGPFDWLKTGCPDKLKVVHSGPGSSWWLIESKNEAKRPKGTVLHWKEWLTSLVAGRTSVQNPNHILPDAAPAIQGPDVGTLFCRRIIKKIQRDQSAVRWSGAQITQPIRSWGNEACSSWWSRDTDQWIQKMKSTLPRNCNRIHIWLHAEIRSQFLFWYVSLKTLLRTCMEKQIKPSCSRRLWNK